jgi:hypothetical protein
MDPRPPTNAELGSASVGSSGDAVQQLIDDACAELGRGIGLDDSRLEALAYSSQPGVVDSVRRESLLRRRPSAEVAEWLDGLGIRGSQGAMRLQSNEGLGLRERVCVPVRHEGELLGFLWILDSPDPLSPGEVEVAAGYAERISVALAHERLLDRRERAVESELVERLVSGEMPPHHIPYELLTAGALMVAVVQLADDGGRSAPELEEAVHGFRQALPPHYLLADIRAEEATMILAGDEAEITAYLTTRLLPLLPGARARIGVGGVKTSAAELEPAHREARLATLAASRLPDLGPVVGWSSLGAYRTLLAMIDAREAPPAVPEPLLRLREVDGDETLLRTLETYLDSGGDTAASAAALAVHRTSLYYRLRRIEEITAKDLRSGDDRLDLHLGLRMMRLIPEAAA